MSVAIIGAIARENVRLGGISRYTQGWETRGNGQRSNYGGILLHHTAGGRNVNIDQILINGRWDLAGPLCNFCIMYDGDIGVIAAHPANHAGASGGWDTSPFARTGLFNSQIIGVEIQYPGTEPMAQVQYEAAKRLTNATLNVLGKPRDYRWAKFHQGTSIEGKWDPGYHPSGKTYSIAQFRKDCAGMPAAAGENPDSPTWQDNRFQLLGPKAA
ncbi:endolysin [Gordonia phage Kvothe]|uniref:Lysin A, N-acetylmuramoyl-L-alanine amidase domain n=3 Tax=Demosthenesvirus katyusha TaxID=1982108 RepID=A0A345MCG4_9CAUD|nr:endolysin [Gordonia phage Kvothe]AXH68185.1 lysin A, N-acetylmuramoyl-L-alanine amidase domain [Gordonia phage Teatealatte]QBP29591.1 lysin A, N-acetylmuramoyl-L-alanine amidase domain [Gordonia phage Tredge]UJD20671.1 lysin A, N-acetylmuramoyl-L-alanine amidase domain [Gordonia phage Niagara]UYL87055.1 lysin A, N-acetylmuramoyl-L-alanine amidase domain [Gordonia phage Hollow]ANA86098.1 lysin A, N-acetylmuramoyl-L-alanine amidase domain [Gordonia phage Kvothe]